ncbi:aspartate kinase [Acuticoccus sp. MNP-M23]|uniref:aspartate kinase n=1 Tax=Acuticoccus sp. MNP-M23 TaxID=3072793 RepID=UPI0028149A4A|nr:aspartate kinase [Acuticoccus sp. MNP-M23]WMS42452.1 aspartate kinase [Acuticoccus sp. MNP-M23]
MPRLVMKFGGTSVADLSRIRHVAAHVAREVEAGNEVAVVVSAMAGETNKLVSLCRDASPLHDAREYDAIVSSGENVTSGLLAIVLQSMGIDARSWQGWQITMRTDDAHGAARIEDIDAKVVLERLAMKQVAVVAGFQGLSPQNRITTLGRGGSDTTAVALAAALDADRCDIYTDVDGVYTTDPRIVKTARRLPKISHEEMLEMASLGAKVLHVRSVELAMLYDVPLMVRSTFTDPAVAPPGTLITGEDIMEQEAVTSIAYARDEAQVTLRDVSDAPGVAFRVFGPLAAANINVDMIVQNISDDGTSTDITFTLPEADYDRAMATLEAAKDDIKFDKLSGDKDVVKVSVIGVGMRSHAGVAATAFKALGEKGINIRAITTSEIKISVLIDSAYTELAVRTLHSIYGLDKS